MKQTLIGLIAIVVATLAVRVPLADIPLDRDEGEYAYIAWRLDFNELPYRDWVDQKPPGVFSAYWLALRLPFAATKSIHLLAALVAAATAAAFFFLARRFLENFWATATALLLALLSADPLAQGLSANTELFMLLPLVLSQLAFFHAAERQGRAALLWALLAGLLNGAAVLCKQVAAVNWLLQLALLPSFTQGEKRARPTVEFLGASLAGLAIAGCPVVAYFWFRNALPDFVANVVTHNLEYINVIPWSERLNSALKSLSGLARSEGLVWVFAAGGLAWLGAKRRQKILLFVAGWLLTSAVGVAASGYFFPHYFQQLLPPLCLAAGFGAEAVADFCTRRFPRRWVAQAAPAGTLAVLPVLVLWPFLLRYSAGDIVARVHPGNPFAEMPALGQRLAQITLPGDRLFVFGSEPELLFYARRPSATRYIILFPLYGPYRGAREKQAAAAEEVARARPAAALFMPNVLFARPGSEQYFSQWSYTYLRESFVPDTYLTLDRRGSVHIVNVAGQTNPPLPEGHQMIGSLLVRKVEGPPQS